MIWMKLATRRKIYEDYAWLALMVSLQLYGCT